MAKDLEQLLKRALSYAESYGTEQQIDDMGYVIAKTAQAQGELDDQDGGLRNPAEHPHHPKDKLKRHIRVQRQIIGKICREIDTES